MTTPTSFTKEQKKELKVIIQKELKPIHTKLNVLGGLVEHAKKTDTQLAGLQKYTETMDNRIGAVEKNIEKLNYVLADHTSRLDRIEERLQQTLTKDFFLQYMDAFIARMDEQHQEIQALHLGWQRHDHAIERLETASKKQAKEIRSITLRIGKK